MGEFQGHIVTERENLRDAGCDDAFIENFLELEKQGKEKEQSAVLARYRESLLDDIHKGQKRLDILDYFIYKRRKAHQQF